MNSNLLRSTLIKSLVLLVAVLVLTGCSSESSTDTTYQMGTLVKMKVYSSQPEKIIADSFQLLEDLEAKMSLNIETSGVNKINQAAGQNRVKVSDDTFQVVKEAKEYAKLSQGAFDPTIAPVVQLWGIGTDQPQVPAEEDLNQRLSLVDYQQISLNPAQKEVFLRQKGMKLDVGGIAKGYAADKIIELLKTRGAKGGFISLGGNISVWGRKPDGSPWKVGIQDPWQPRGEVMASIDLTDKTVVTSGNYERYFEQDGRRYHHILDPKTGTPARKGVISSTIITDNSTQADALATAVYVLGRKQGLELITGLAGVESIVVTEDNQVYLTPGIESKVEIIKSNKYEVVEWSTGE